jgi:putative iron-only hydrogenase system regulator
MGALLPWFGERALFLRNERGAMEEKRIAIVRILVADRCVSDKVNALLSEYGDWILGRMGIPYKEKGVSILSVALDAPLEITNALTGKLGKINGVSVKALFGKL